MPRRVSKVRHPSEDIQGEGSYVVLRKLTWKEMKDRGWLSDKKDEKGNQRIEQGEALITYCLVEWNWADDDGSPLPLPSNDPTVIDGFTDEEVAFLLEKIVGSKVEIAQKKTS